MERALCQTTAYKGVFVSITNKYDFMVKGFQGKNRYGKQGHIWRVWKHNENCVIIKITIPSKVRMIKNHSTGFPYGEPNQEKPERVKGRSL
jgi:hypothetical protein